MKLLFIFLLIILILFILHKKENYENESIDYDNDVEIRGNVKCEKNVSVNGDLNINKLKIDDIELNKTKLNELTQLPLVNLTNICLTDPDTNEGLCFTKEDIITLKSLYSDINNNSEIYLRWDV
tara:strand:+ start:329 stop:700 length:372 start_codon:yes stop_codon:yes gene_type:complete